MLFPSNLQSYATRVSNETDIRHCPLPLQAKLKLYPSFQSYCSAIPELHPSLLKNIILPTPIVIMN